MRRQPKAQTRPPENPPLRILWRNHGGSLWQVLTLEEAARKQGDLVFSVRASDGRWSAVVLTDKPERNYHD